MGDGNVLKLTLVMAAQLCEYTENHGSKASNPNPWVLRLQGPSAAPGDRQGGAGARAAAGSTPPPERDAEKGTEAKEVCSGPLRPAPPSQAEPGRPPARFLAKGKGAGEGGPRAICSPSALFSSPAV